MKSTGRKRIGLALGGGVVRGLAHLGVLAVLEREKIPIDFVAGTSVGSVAGAAYCAGLESTRRLQIAEQASWRKLASLTWPAQGFISFAKLEHWLIDLLGDLDFRQLSLPFTAVATDSETGVPVYLTEGRLAPAVRASCSVPGIVAPVRMDGRMLVDGGISENLPVNAVRAMGANYVIAVDICRPTFDRGWGPLGFGVGGLENLVHRAGGGITTADCLISPDLRGFSYVRFSQRKELIARGAKATEEQLARINAALSD